MSLLTEELAALRLVLASSAADNKQPTQSQLIYLNTLLGEGLADHRRALRIAILRELTGLEIESSKELSSGMVHSLITYLKHKESSGLNDNGTRIIQEIAARCVEGLPPRRPRKRRVEKRDALAEIGEVNFDEQGAERTTQDAGNGGDRGPAQRAEEPVVDPAWKTNNPRLEAALQRMRAAFTNG